MTSTTIIPRPRLPSGRTAASRAAGCRTSLLSVGGAAPVCNIFGQNISAACVSAIGITSTNVTTAQMAGAQASVTGTMFDMPAGPVAFALGGEWRSTSAQYVPDSFLSSGDVAGFNAALPTRGSRIGAGSLWRASRPDREGRADDPEPQPERRFPLFGL